MTLLIILPVVQWSPCHTVVAIPLIIAFELLLCCYLDTREGMYWFINVLILKAVDSHKPCHIFTDVSAGDNVTRVFFSDLRHIQRWNKIKVQGVFGTQLETPEKAGFIQYWAFVLLVGWDPVHDTPAVSLKVVFLPLLAFQAVILIDNFRFISWPKNHL